MTSQCQHDPAEAGTTETCLQADPAACNTMAAEMVVHSQFEAASGTASLGNSTNVLLPLEMTAMLSSLHQKRPGSQCHHQDLMLMHTA